VFVFAIVNYRADNQPFLPTTEQLENGVLQFIRVTGQEQGRYICSATNSAGTATYAVELIIRGQ